MLAGTDVVFALGLVALAKAQGPEGLFGAWIILGVGMGSGLYEAAFAALVRLYGHGSRDAITGITLIAGFASTVGWPLSTLIEHEVSWRGACYTWAGLHILIGLPLNLLLPKASMQPADGFILLPAVRYSTLRQSSSANRVRRRPVPARCS